MIVKKRISEVTAEAALIRLEDYLREVGKLKVEIDRINADTAAKIEEIKSDAQEKARPVLAELARSLENIYAHVRVNQDLLAGNPIQQSFAKRGSGSRLKAVEKTGLRRLGKRPLAGDFDIEVSLGFDGS